MAEDEKAEELEALMAIYMDDFKMRGEDTFTINLVPNPGSDDDLVGIEMEVTYTSKYPQEAPMVRLKSKKGVTEPQRKELEAKVKLQAQENLGIAMIFTLAQTVKDWLDAHNDDEYNDDDNKNTTVEFEEDEGKVIAQVGTPVTLENFIAWKKAFDAEMFQLKKAKIDLEKLRRPTGRQLFEIDASLIMSDAALLDEGDQVASFSAAAARAALEQQQQQQLPQELPASNVNWELFNEEDIDDS